MLGSQSQESLFKLVHCLKQNVLEQIEELDLDIAPMHVRVLKIISRKPQCTAVDIANFLERDKAQVTRLLNSLIKQELVVKAPNPEDKRSQCLRITDSGLVIMSKIAGVDKAMLEKMKQGISEEEMEKFQRIMAKMISNLSN
ncbi:MarR family winged helix-turn-helix transcriptional regulator [Photobacterium nomapromontoriensis]|uniref:MarR family winged helix-turn-helix transcriptional regulator n=1 Tax=Photobacterium nomapromontoriensis TaxID=2910237 RepID=UPI003D0E949A